MFGSTGGAKRCCNGATVVVTSTSKEGISGVV